MEVWRGCYSQIWANGFVAPFLGIDQQTATVALKAAKVSKGDKVVDLGCGDGRVCIAACSMGADGIGFDLDEDLIKKAKSLSIEMPTETEKKPTFHVNDLFAVDLNGFSVICMFLLPETMDLLVPKLLVALSKGSRIISFGWSIPRLGEPTSCCRGKVDSTAVKRWFLYTRGD